jgi:translation initiation factor IF-2
MGEKKIRVYDLAKEFKLTNAEMIEKLAKSGIEVKSHMSGVEESLVEIFRAEVKGEETKSEPTASEEVEEVVEESLEEISVKSPVVVKDFAEALGIKANALIVELMGFKVMASVTQTLDHDIVEKVAAKHNKVVNFEKRDKSHIVKKGDQVAPEEVQHKGNKKDQMTRPPVVAFMGHVDHGKTSLQDALRKTSVTSGEAGGITQHIGSSVLHHEGSTITMLDTPGHAAFSAMRARGANVTDIAILVVAANDGVMPQTIEAIRHARAANIPIIVAMNKMDLEEANPDNVLVQLQQQNLMTEDWGGDIGCVRVSAITGEGLDELLDRIVLEAEMMELSANPKLPGKAVVVEAQMEVGVGVQANILVQDGTIKVGDTVICGSAYGRVKALIDSTGARAKSIGPSMPAQLIGLNELPEVGTTLVVCKNERQAKKIAQERAHEARQSRLTSRRPGSSLEDLFSRVEESRKAELSVIVKADVKGSLEAIEQALNDFPSDRVRLNIVDASIGAITENDIVLAESSNAFVMGFHVRVNPGVNKAAERAGIDIRLYSVIYELLQDVHDALEGKLEPERREEILGEAEIAEVFVVGNKGQKVCGSRVNEGYVAVGCKARVYRKKELIYNGSVSSLRRFKDDVKEVKAGFECGILLDNFKDFEEGDIISLYQIIEKKATL